jgi:hypothetical protein
MTMKLANIYEVTTGILAEGTPIAAPPVSSRIGRSPVRDGGNNGGDFELYAFLADGTNITATVWIRLFDDEWYQLGSAAVMGPNEVERFANVPPDVDVFVQLTAPAGTPTTFGFSFV